jgi:chromosome segregation ATPase
MRKFLILLILLVIAAPAYGATIYKWVDEKGVINFTDEYKKVPPAFRNRAETEEYLEEEPPPIFPQKMAAKIKEEVETDIYGRDYWKKELDEATSNYEKVREELLKEGERLVWQRYGGKTQYQMFTTELPGMGERLEAYREQMIEAKAMLDEFTKETQGIEDGHGKRSISSKTDIYGRDETWWKENVRPWKEQMKEATQNYDEACDAFVKQLERLGPFRWGRLSLTQYQMISSRLTELSGRMAEYQTQISEAKSMLTKLSREAKETKADPAWLE